METTPVLDIPRDYNAAEDLVGGKMALYSFAANLKVVKTEQDMLGTLFDAKA